MRSKILQLIIACLLIPAFLIAQTPPIQVTIQQGQTYSQAVMQNMQNINTSRIPYSVLYDKVFGWANLDMWTIGDTTSFSHIKQSWWDLENSMETPLALRNVQ